MSRTRPSPARRASEDEGPATPCAKGEPMNMKLQRMNTERERRSIAFTWGNIAGPGPTPSIIPVTTPRCRLSTIFALRALGYRVNRRRRDQLGLIERHGSLKVELLEP